jgi:hypothetical protein
MIEPEPILGVGARVSAAYTMGIAAAIIGVLHHDAWIAVIAAAGIVATTWMTVNTYRWYRAVKTNPSERTLSWWRRRGPLDDADLRHPGVDVHRVSCCRAPKDESDYQTWKRTRDPWAGISLGLQSSGSRLSYSELMQREWPNGLRLSVSPFKEQ